MFFIKVRHLKVASKLKNSQSLTCNIKFSEKIIYHSMTSSLVAGNVKTSKLHSGATFMGGSFRSKRKIR